MTEPDEQPEREPEPQSGEDNVQTWKTTIHAEAEVIPGEPEED